VAEDLIEVKISGKKTEVETKKWVIGFEFFLSSKEGWRCSAFCSLPIQTQNLNFKLLAPASSLQIEFKRDGSTNINKTLSYL